LLLGFANLGLCLEQENLKVHFISVGYGDAILIQLPDHKSILIDSGTKDSAAELVDYLKALNISTIEAVFITHPHDNHFGGMSAVIDNFLVKHLYSNGDDRSVDEGYAPLMAKIKDKKIPLIVLRKGDKLNFTTPDVEFLILNPEKLSKSTNQDSLVSWFRFKESSFLFTADINQEQQKEIIDSFPEIKRADCIQVPHHGGKVSRRFAAFFGQKYFVVSTGEDESGKPYINELEKIRGKILRTDQRGTIVLESNGKTVWVIQ